jgi:hypothetical protein
MLGQMKQHNERTAPLRSTLSRNVRSTAAMLVAHPGLLDQHLISAAAGVSGVSRPALRAAVEANVTINVDQPLAVFVLSSAPYKNKTPEVVVELIFKFWESNSRLRGGKAGAPIHAPKGQLTCGTGSTHAKQWLEESQTELFIRCVVLLHSDRTRGCNMPR